MLSDGQTLEVLLKLILEFSNKIRTAWRRISHPVSRKDLVIDIGCGGLPNPRADIACDAFPEDSERDTKLRIDREFVWAHVDALPFKDKIFDYSILSHVLEHLEEPERALKEIERISKAGYIETPNSFYEYAIPHTYHVSRCTVIDGKLIIAFKKTWDETLDEGEYRDVIHDMQKNWWDLHRLDSVALLTRYRWQDRIDFEIYGSNRAFAKDDELIRAHSRIETRSRLRELAIKTIYFIMKPRKRISLLDLLACPQCKSDLEFVSDEELSCRRCAASFRKMNGFFDFRLRKAADAIVT